MRLTTRSLTLFVLLLAAPLAAARSPASPGQSPSAGGGHSGLPTPRVTLHADEARLPFVVPEVFPVPVVEVLINGGGPWRLAVDTAMGGTVLLRQELVGKIGLPVVGKAMVGDSSGAEFKPAELVRIDSLRLGELEVGEIYGLGFAADQAHISEVPDDIHGILGNQIYAELLMTLDYPARHITFRAGELTVDDASVVEFVEEGGVMVIDLELPERTVPVIVDSGSRGSITLPESLATELPLLDKPRDVASFSTVSRTYRRKAAQLDGQASVAGATLVNPEIGFADESTPRLIGYGVLKDFAITVDQAHGRLRMVKVGGE